MFASLLALSATAAMTAALTGPASAASGQGEATIVAANHSKGRTLSGQGVKLAAGPGASGQGGRLSLPIAELTTGAQPAATSAGSLSFKRGKRSLALTAIRFDLGAGTLVGKLGDAEIPVFKLGATPVLSSDSATLRDGLSERKAT